MRPTGQSGECQATGSLEPRPSYLGPYVGLLFAGGHLRAAFGFRMNAVLECNSDLGLIESRRRTCSGLWVSDYHAVVYHQ